MLQNIFRNKVDVYIVSVWTSFIPTRNLVISQTHNFSWIESVILINKAHFCRAECLTCAHGLNSGIVFGCKK